MIYVVVVAAVICVAVIIAVVVACSATRLTGKGQAALRQIDAMYDQAKADSARVVAAARVRRPRSESVFDRWIS
jgi:hypothetical protein